MQENEKAKATPVHPIVIHPSEYEPHSIGDGRRFHVRMHNPGSGRCWEVYGYGLDHICDCQSVELANMVAAALEQAAEGG